LRETPPGCAPAPAFLSFVWLPLILVFDSVRTVGGGGEQFARPLLGSPWVGSLPCRYWPSRSSAHRFRCSWSPAAGIDQLVYRAHSYPQRV